jgi:hypothetical protein
MVNKHELRARIVAVGAWFVSWFRPELKLAFFNKQYQDTVPEEERVSDKHVAEFINKWGQRFWEKGELTDEHGGGMPVKVPAELAQEAVTLVKYGYETYVDVKNPRKALSTVGHHRVKVHRFYTSLANALEELPRLREIMRQCQCTVDQLWEAMVRVDPDLTKRRVYYKWLLSKADKFERQFYGELLFNMWLSYMAIGNIFYRTVYIDECRIHLGAELKHGVKVICDKHDQRVSEIIETPWLKPHQEITLHFIVAVNPSAGLWYISFTTGTTPPIDNSPVARNLTLQPYQVSSRYTADTSEQLTLLHCCSLRV